MRKFIYSTITEPCSRVSDTITSTLSGDLRMHHFLCNLSYFPCCPFPLFSDPWQRENWRERGRRPEFLERWQLLQLEQRNGFLFLVGLVASSLYIFLVHHKHPPPLCLHLHPLLCFSSLLCSLPSSFVLFPLSSPRSAPSVTSLPSTCNKSTWYKH